MPGPPIRKPSDHSPPAGSPRNIAGHHVLHRPLMPRHPPNAQKNKQQRHTNKTRNTLSQKSYSKMLASTIQFTTNPPTPTHNPQQPGAPDRSGNQGALPQNPDSMPPPHTQGHPPPADHHDHNSPSSPPQRACLSCQHQTTNHPAHQCTTVGHPALPRGAAPAGPDPYNGPDNQRPGSHPHNQSLERR